MIMATKNNTSNALNALDCISRQAAIDAVKGRFSMPVDNLIVEVIGALPSAQPERGEGVWIEEDDAIIHGHCSKCGWVSVWQETDVFGINFCPNCGAKMGGEQE